MSKLPGGIWSLSITNVYNYMNALRIVRKLWPGYILKALPLRRLFGKVGNANKSDVPDRMSLHLLYWRYGFTTRSTFCEDKNLLTFCMQKLTKFYLNKKNSTQVTTNCMVLVFN